MLASIGGDTLEVSISPVKAILLPGKQGKVSAEVTAPSTPGHYQAFFRLCGPRGRRFGQRLWMDLYVASSS